LYGRILFHHARFARIEEYELLHSDRSIARLGSPTGSPWFARHLPAELVLGDAASRDAALHSIQACIPHKTILPVGIDRIVPMAAWTRSSARVQAVEQASDGDNFIYDLYIEDTAGQSCERWEGLQLRAVAAIEAKEPWPLALLAPYLERVAGQVLKNREIKIGFVRTKKEEQEGAISSLVHELFGNGAALAHRPDGKPEITGLRDSSSDLSISHAGDITLLFAANQNAGCDLEQIVSRDISCWRKLLGRDDFALARLLADQSIAGFDIAASQIWSLKESLRKAGAGFGQPMSLSSCSPDGWATFSSSGLTATTFHASIADAGAAFAFGFVLRGTR
jgi:enediyne polyketide synthase